MSELVSNAELAAAIQRRVDAQALSFCQVARQVFPLRADRCKPDVSRLKRALGVVTPGRTGGVHPPRQRRLNYDFALRIAEASNIDPVEVGL